MFFSFFLVDGVQLAGGFIPGQKAGKMLHALTIDFEEYYQGILTIDPADYGRWPGRIERNTEKVLRLFDEYGAKATFFVSGHVAERFPQVVHRVKEEGHEIASHGYRHGLLYELSREQVRQDLVRAAEVICPAAGIDRLTGFRAPWWSLTEKNRWVWEVLDELGYAYDSSVNPIRMRYYGNPGAPRAPYRVDGTRLVEIPPSAVEFFGVRLSVAGGFYWRNYPLWLIRAGIKRLEKEGLRAVCIFHPWEIDLDEPAIPGLPLEQRLIHYAGRRTMERKIRAVLSEFQFSTISRVFAAELAPEG